jgi:hypothetical protein
MKMPPGFDAEATLYRTKNNYWMASTGTESSVASGYLLLQQDSLGGCFGSLDRCQQACAQPTDPGPSRCYEVCDLRFLRCVDSIGEGMRGPTGGMGGRTREEGRIIERCTCVPDARSRRWMRYCCYTAPGASGRATQCFVTEECPAEGCGPFVGLPGCACTSAGTCTQQCRRYVRALFGNREVVYRQPCIPVEPLPIPGPPAA